MNCICAMNFESMCQSKYVHECTRNGTRWVTCPLKTSPWQDHLVIKVHWVDNEVWFMGKQGASLQGSENALVPTRLGWQGITWGKVLHALVLCKEQGIQEDFLWDASHFNDSCGPQHLDWKLLWLDCRIWPWGHGRQNLRLFEKNCIETKSKVWVVNFGLS